MSLFWILISILTLLIIIAIKPLFYLLDAVVYATITYTADRIKNIALKRKENK